MTQNALPYVSVLSGIPKNTPAFIRSHKILSRAYEAGFRWPNIELVLGKINEELDEVKKAAASDNKQHASEEVGDMFSAITTLVVFTNTDPAVFNAAPVATAADDASHMEEALVKVKAMPSSENIQNLVGAVVGFAQANGIDPEVALQSTNDKFTYRFDSVGKELHDEGLTMNDIKLRELIERWNKYKVIPEAPAASFKLG